MAWDVNNPKKGNANDLGYIIIKINDEYHYFKINMIGTKWCIIYDLTSKFSKILNIFHGKLLISIDWRTIYSGSITSGGVNSFVVRSSEVDEDGSRCCLEPTVTIMMGIGHHYNFVFPPYPPLLTILNL